MLNLNYIIYYKTFFFLNKFKKFRINKCKHLNGIYNAISYMISKYMQAMDKLEYYYCNM